MNCLENSITLIKFTKSENQIDMLLAEPGAGDGLGKAVPFFERQYLTGSFYLYHSFSVIVAQPLSSNDMCKKQCHLGGS